MYAKGVTNVIKQNQIDLIHAHWAYPEGFVGLLAKQSTDKPLVVTLHGKDILAESATRYGMRLYKHRNTAVKQVLQKADRILVASKYVYNATIRANCPPEKITILPMGTDLIRFNPNIDGQYFRKKLSLNLDPVIFTVRHHVPKNGIEYLIKAFPRVLKKYPKTRLIIGGTGPLINYHRDLTQKLGISSRIIFTDRISQHELPYYYAACDIFVIPSVLEAFGIVTLEAMACGKPVIGSNTGGIAEIIQDQINGLLFNPRDPQDLANKIIGLIQRRDLRVEFGVKGRRIAEEKYDITNRIKTIKQVLEETAQNT